MIYRKTDASKYKEDFMKKFASFGDKSPIMLSFACDDLGVSVVHENSGNKYFYPWDFTIELESFIHAIKQDLVYKHYPRIIKVDHIIRDITSEEIAEQMAEGKTLDEIPSQVEEDVSTTFIIDKYIAQNDNFILINENTREQYNYRMNGAGIFYLKNYRNGKFKTLEEAGEEFFKRSELLYKCGEIETTKSGKKPKKK